MKKKTIEPAEEIETHAEEIDDNDNHDDVSEWLETANAAAYGYKAVLYRIRDRKKCIVWEYRNELPGIHDIGIKFGGGSYEMYIVINSKDKKNRVKIRRFNLDDHYNSIAAAMPTTQTPAISGNGGHIGESLAIIKEVIAALQPIMNKNPLLDMSQVAVQQFTMMQEIMRQSIKENMAMARAVIKREYDDLNELDEEPEEIPAPIPTTALPAPASGETGKDLVESIIAALQPYLPKILGEGIDSAAIVNLIKALPQYQGIMSDRDNLKKLIAGFKTNFGEEKTKNLLEKFGVKTE